MSEFENLIGRQIPASFFEMPDDIQKAASFAAVDLPFAISGDEFRAVEYAFAKIIFTELHRHGLRQVAPSPEPQMEGRAGEMTPDRAIYFLERFKREEKMLGPNEQWALEFAIAALSPSAQPRASSSETWYRWRGPKGGWIFDVNKPSWDCETIEVRRNHV